MPFDELGGDPGDMLADGMVEEITNALSRVHDFHVIARQSAFALRDTHLSVPEQALRLGADYLVEGTLQRARARLRLSIQLVSGEDGRSLWSARFDEHLDDLFEMQDRIAAQVAGQLSPRLRHAEIERAHRVPQTDRSAYAQVMSALPHFWKHQQSENLMAIRHLDQALALSPNYGPALAYKAWAVAQMSSYIWSDSPAADRAASLAIARRAAEVTEDHAPSLVAIAAALSLSLDDQTPARRYLDRALVLDPNNSWGWMRLGWVEVYDENFDAAEACFRKAEALSPLDPFRFNMLMGRAAVRLYSDRDADEGLRLIEEGMALVPGMSWANRMRASAYMRLGRPDLARRALEDMVRASPGLTRERFLDGITKRRPLYAELLDQVGMPES